jgi:hypothetical protein
MAGYRKPPQYGGPEVNWRRIFWTFVVLMLLAAAVAYFR